MSKKVLLENNMKIESTKIQDFIAVSDIISLLNMSCGFISIINSINGNFETVEIHRYGACGKVYLNGTAQYDVGEHYCYAWIVKNGNMIGSIVPTTYPQVYDNYEINAVTDIVALYLLPDDSPKFCSLYYTTYRCRYDATQVFVIPKSDIASWINKYENET